MEFVKWKKRKQKEVAVNLEDVVKPDKDVPKKKLKLRVADGICSISVAIDTVRALSKLNNLSPSKLIKFYIEKERPVLIYSDVSTYGELYIYLRNSE